MNNINNLRHTPRQYLSSEFFCLDTSLANNFSMYQAGVQGDYYLKQSSDIFFTTPNTNLLDIHISRNGDFFFPYHPQTTTIANGTGYCIVRPITGTIVATGGMNGCALDVRWNTRDGTYYFFHDKNGRTLQLTSPILHQVCRIEATWYYNDRYVNYLIDQRLLLYDFICVFDGHDWHVGCYGAIHRKTDRVVNTRIISESTLHAIVYPKHNNNSSYVGTFNNATTLIKR